MSLWLIFDLVIILIFAICIIHSMRQGFVKASSAILSIILTIVMMFAFQDSINEYLKNSQFGKTVNEKITEALTKQNTEEPKEEEVKENNFGLPLFFSSIAKDTEEKIESVKNDLIKEAAERTTASVINILSIVILYIAIRILLFFGLKIINMIFKLPLLKSVNKLAGAAIGFVNALFIVYILCAGLIWFVPNNNSEIIKDTIEDTYITKYFYNNNMLLELFM